MSDEKRKTAEHPSIKKDEQGEAARETGHISHDEEARGYIAGFLELDYLDDLAAVLQAAEQITGRPWSVVVTAEGAQIEALDEDDSSVESASEAEEGDDEEIFELEDEVDSDADDDDIDEDSFAEFEDAFADEDE